MDKTTLAAYDIVKQAQKLIIAKVTRDYARWEKMYGHFSPGLRYPIADHILAGLNRVHRRPA